MSLLAGLAISTTQASIAEGAPRDTVAPSVSWKTPAASATVSGTLWEPTNSGPSGACAVNASDNVGVTKVVFFVDSTALNTELTAPYNCKFNSTTVRDGSHTLKAVAYDAAGRTATALRTVNVKNTPDPADKTAPSVSWKTPAASATVSGTLWEPANSGPSGTCESSASDNVAVAKVIFSVDATALNTEDVAPYNCKFDSTKVPDGSHTLKAVAYDGAGNSSTTTRTVTVDNVPDPDTTAPSVSWTTPAADATVAGTLWEAANSGPSGPCEVAASDSVGVAKVIFYVDGGAANTDAVAPYNCNFDSTTVPDDSHTLKAVAYDAAGNTTAASRTITVDNVPNDVTAPSVSWTRPAADASVSGVISGAACEADATDDFGVAKVVFSVDGTALNEATSAPYDCSFDTTTVPDGSHTLKAVASDAAGNASFASRTVIVDNVPDPPPADTTPPSVSWTTPASGATVSATLFEATNSGPSGPCEAAASDNVAISKVVFYVDATQLNAEGVAPYNCKFDTKTVPDGSHILKAVAYDAAGNTTTDTRTVTVKNDVTPPPPPVTPGRTLILDENFDGTTYDATKWGAYTSAGHAGNGLRRPSAITVENGQLVITGTWDGSNITSGGMYHKYNQLYGSYEFRARADPDPSGQMSAVVLTWPASNRWIPDGEIDMWETGHSPLGRNPWNTFVHRSVDGVTDHQVQLKHNSDAAEWHIIRVDWTASSIRTYVDGVFDGQVTDPRYIPNVPHHAGIQLDAFGNRAMSAPVKMYVDWIRVYN